MEPKEHSSDKNLLSRQEEDALLASDPEPDLETSTDFTTGPDHEEMLVSPSHEGRATTGLQDETVNLETESIVQVEETKSGNTTTHKVECHDIRYKDRPSEVSVHVGTNPGISKDKFIEIVENPPAQPPQDIFQAADDVVVEGEMEEEDPLSPLAESVKSGDESAYVSANENIRTSPRKSVMEYKLVEEDSNKTVLERWEELSSSLKAGNPEVQSNRILSGKYYLPPPPEDTTIGHHCGAVKRSLFLSRLNPNAANCQRFFDIRDQAMIIPPKIDRPEFTTIEGIENRKELLAYKYWDASWNVTYEGKLIKQIEPDGRHYAMYTQKEPFPATVEEEIMMNVGLNQVMKVCHIAKPSEYPNKMLYGEHELDDSSPENYIASTPSGEVVRLNEDGPPLPVPIPIEFENNFTTEVLKEAAKASRLHRPAERCKSQFRLYRDVCSVEPSTPSKPSRSWGEEVEEEERDSAEEAGSVYSDAQMDSPQSDEDRDQGTYSVNPFRDIINKFNLPSNPADCINVKAPGYRVALSGFEDTNDILEFIERYVKKLTELRIPISSFAHLVGNDAHHVWRGRTMEHCVVFKPGIVCPFSSCPGNKIKFKDADTFYGHWRIFHIKSGASFVYCRKCQKHAGKFSDAKDHMCRCYQTEDEGHGWHDKTFMNNVKKRKCDVPPVFYEKMARRFIMVWYPNLVTSDTIRPEVVIRDEHNKGSKSRKGIDFKKHIYWIWLNPNLKDPRLPLSKTQRAPIPRPFTEDWQLCEDNGCMNYGEMLDRGLVIKDLDKSDFGENKLYDDNEKLKPRVTKEMVSHALEEVSYADWLAEQETSQETSGGNQTSGTPVEDMELGDESTREDDAGPWLTARRSRARERQQRKTWKDVEKVFTSPIPPADKDPVPYPIEPHNEPIDFEKYVQARAKQAQTTYAIMGHKVFIELELMIHYQFLVREEQSTPEEVERVDQSIYRLRKDRQVLKVSQGLFPSTPEKNQRRSAGIRDYFDNSSTRAEIVSKMPGFDTKRPIEEGHPFRFLSKEELTGMRFFSHQLPGHHGQWNRRIPQQFKDEYIEWNNKRWGESHPRRHREGKGQSAKSLGQSETTKSTSSGHTMPATGPYAPRGRGTVLSSSDVKQVGVTTRGRSPTRNYDTRSSLGSYRDRSNSAGSRNRSNSSGKGRTSKSSTSQAEDKSASKTPQKDKPTHSFSAEEVSQTPYSAVNRSSISMGMEQGDREEAGSPQQMDTSSPLSPLSPHNPKDLGDVANIQLELTGSLAKKRKLEFTVSDITTCGRKIAETIIQNDDASTKNLLKPTLTGLANHCKSVVGVTSVVIDQVKQEYKKELDVAKEKISELEQENKKLKDSLEKSMEMIQDNEMLDKLKAEGRKLADENAKLKAALKEAQDSATKPSSQAPPSLARGLGRGSQLMQVVGKLHASSGSPLESLDPANWTEAQKAQVLSKLKAVELKNPRNPMKQTVLLGKVQESGCSYPQGYPLFYPNRCTWMDIPEDTDSLETFMFYMNETQKEWKEYLDKHFKQE